MSINHSRFQNGLGCIALSMSFLVLAGCTNQAAEPSVASAAPVVAAAAMVGQPFPFTQWAASMRHQEQGPHQSLLIYTYTFQVGPAALRAVMEPLVDWVFVRKTRQRFQRLAQFLAVRAADIAAWQQTQGVAKSAAQKAHP